MSAERVHVSGVGAAFDHRYSIEFVNVSHRASIAGDVVCVGDGCENAARSAATQAQK